MDKLRLFRKDVAPFGNDWFTKDAEGNDCPITIKMEFNGWRPIYDPSQNAAEFAVETYGSIHTVRFGTDEFGIADNGQACLYGIFDTEDNAVNEFYIPARHPVAHVFHKTCKFDGVEYLVPIYYMSPKQPY